MAKLSKGAENYQRNRGILYRRVRELNKELSAQGLEPVKLSLPTVKQYNELSRGQKAVLSRTVNGGVKSGFALLDKYDRDKKKRKKEEAKAERLRLKQEKLLSQTAEQRNKSYVRKINNEIKKYEKSGYIVKNPNWKEETKNSFNMGDTKTQIKMKGKTILRGGATYRDTVAFVNIQNGISTILKKYDDIGIDTSRGYQLLDKISRLNITPEEMKALSAVGLWEVFNVIYLKDTAEAQQDYEDLCESMEEILDTYTKNHINKMKGSQFDANIKTETWEKMTNEEINKFANKGSKVAKQLQTNRTDGLELSKILSSNDDILTQQQKDNINKRIAGEEVKEPLKLDDVIEGAKTAEKILKGGAKLGVDDIVKIVKLIGAFV